MKNRAKSDPPMCIKKRKHKAVKVHRRKLRKWSVHPHLKIIHIKAKIYFQIPILL